MSTQPPSDDDDVGIDPAIVALLMQLFTASRDSPDKPWSLAKLARRVNFAMSTLRRHLAELVEAGLVDVTVQEDGRGFAVLTEEGVVLCEALFSEDADDPRSSSLDDDDDGDDHVDTPPPRRLH